MATDRDASPVRPAQAATETTTDASGLNDTAGRPPRVGHKKSRKGCAQCKRRHVKCNEESPCSNCIRHGVLCSLAGGPNPPRDDVKSSRKAPSPTASSTIESTTSFEASATSIANSPPTPNPLSILTGLIERPLSGQDQAWRLDLQLMHHYTTYAGVIFTGVQELDNFTLRIWKEEVPALAFTCDCLMHALLGFTALHKAHLEPDKAVLSQASAVEHLDKALMLHRGIGVTSTAENANAKYLFAWLVALFAFAVPPSVPPIDAVVELLMLVKGMDAVLTENWYWVAQGPLAPILTKGFQQAIIIRPDGTSPVPEGIDFGLGHLEYMLGLHPMLPDERRILTLIVHEIGAIYDSLSPTRGSGSCSIASILCFPKQDPTAFASMIKRRVPQALVILCFYCVALNVLERWWVEGLARRVVADVVESVGEEWKTWMQWPMQVVLMGEGGEGEGG